MAGTLAPRALALKEYKRARLAPYHEWYLLNLLVLMRGRGGMVDTLA